MKSRFFAFEPEIYSGESMLPSFESLRNCIAFNGHHWAPFRPMKIRRLNRRDRAEWVLDYYEAGKRIRRWFRSKALAEAEADALKDQKRTCGEAWTDLSPADRS